MSKHSKTVRNINAFSDMSPLSFKAYARLLVSKLTTRVTSQALNWEIIFFPIKDLSSLSPCWFFICAGGKCRRPIILCTVQGYFWRARLRSDAICVTRPDHWVRSEVLNQILIGIWGGRSTTLSPHHHPIITAFLRRCLVLDRPTHQDPCASLWRSGWDTHAFGLDKTQF